MSASRLRRLGTFAGLALAGAAHALSFAPGPLPLWALAPVQILALAWLANATLAAATCKQAFAKAWLFSVVNFSIGLYWIFISLHTYGYLATPLAVMGVLALAAFLALYPGLACALSHALSHPAPHTKNNGRLRALFIVISWAASWVLFEWLRGTLLSGFPWLNIAYAHVDSPIAGWAPVLGVYGMAFIAALAAACLGALMRPVPHRALVASAALALVLVGIPIGDMQWAQTASHPLSIRLVQGNIEQSQKFDIDKVEKNLLRYMTLASSPGAPSSEPVLIILPETVLPVFQDHLPLEVWTSWQDIAAEQNATLIMGAPLHDRINGADRYTNSVIGLNASTLLEDLAAGRSAMRYDKHHLVPFGEYVPPGFRWFVNMLNIPLGDFDRGQIHQTPFPVQGQHIALNICYEDLFGHELLLALRSDRNGEPGASILINVSNLGWFGNTWALRQHLQIARLRTLETARPLLTATNTGITAAIDAYGQVTAQLPPHQAGVLRVSAQGMSGLTPYTRYGDFIALGLIGFLLLAALVHRQRKAGRK
jgi:apolipoprotein N-acyltransferase